MHIRLHRKSKDHTPDKQRHTARHGRIQTRFNTVLGDFSAIYRVLQKVAAKAYERADTA